MLADDSDLFFVNVANMLHLFHFQLKLSQIDFPKQIYLKRNLKVKYF